MYKNSFKNEYDNFKLNPYRAKNMIAQKTEAINPQPELPVTETPQETQELPAEQSPESPAVESPSPVGEESQNTIQPTVGSVAVGVFTALGALPVKDAIVTIYGLDKNGEETVFYYRTTDESGRIPDTNLAVFYDPTNPYVSPEFYFTTYNLRVQAINYYTQNILDFRVFPGVKTNLRVNLLPVIQGENQETAPEQTIVIPPNPSEMAY